MLHYIREMDKGGAGMESLGAEDFGFVEMQKMQSELQEKYRGLWEPVVPQTGKNKLMWMLIEAGEAADIIKKDGAEKIVDNEETRRHFIEELADVMMYFNDIMSCFDISVEEFKQIYRMKHNKNMERWQSDDTAQ